MGWLLGSKNDLTGAFQVRRYWIDKSQIQDSQVVFKDELFHHIFDVCRQEVGHKFEVITEDSKAYLVEVTSKEKKLARAKILEDREIKPLPKPHIHLTLSIPRYAVMDSVIERAVEMGVSSIVPFFSDFSFIRKISNLPEGKKDRWDKIVISASQQSGRGELMRVLPPVAWEQMLQYINPSDENWCLFAYEGASVLSVQDLIQTKKKVAAENQSLTQTKHPENLWIIVGSEGGFSSQEVAHMQQLGLHPVTLGAQILRVETACLTLVSVLKYEFGLLK